MTLQKFIALLCFAFFYLLSSSAMAGAKTDTITLYNGDKVTCEVKQLSKGKLQAKTSDMGTLSVKWYKIAAIETKHVMEIVLRDRTKIYGIMNKADSLGYVVISSGMMIEDVYRIMDIVSIDQVATSFWKGLDGSVSYGLSYAKGTNNLQSNFAGNVKYRSNRFLNRLVLNSIISDNSDRVSRKQDVTYSLYYYFKRRAFLLYQLGWQQNTELGIDNRVITAVSAGYTAAQSNSQLLKFSGGTSLNIESTNENEFTQDLEGIVNMTYDLFLFANPKININTSATVFPSFTNPGRLRSDINFTMSWEIFSDFTFGVTFYFNSDNKPRSSTASTEDWGTTTSIGYTF